MNYTVKQVAQKLKISNGRVRGLIRAGLLHDVKAAKHGEMKHYAEIDSKELAEFIKSEKAKEILSKRATRISNGNSNPGPQAVNGFRSQLNRIEAKLDKLISMWS